MSHKQNNHQDNATPRKDETMDGNAAVLDDVQEAFDEQNSVEDEENAIIDKQLSDIDALTQQLKDAEAQVEKEKKEYLFLMAEFDNYRKRVTREKADIIKNAAERVLLEILPIVDDFERALAATADSTESLREGMTLIYHKLIKYLERNGVKPMDTDGKPFDPDFHEAIAKIPAPSDELKGKVVDTTTKGYMLNDKVLRHAKVAVGE